MVDFGRPLYGHHPATDYFAPPSNAMEPQTYGHDVSFGTPDLGVDRIGMSVPLGIAAQNVAGIYSKIRMGVGSMEIQFPGYRSGNRQSQTPEMYGEDQRTAIRELAMANEVDFTTHASFQMMGMTGFDGGRSYDVKNAVQNLQELKTAIDFQADIAKGGSVVMHAGEFDRPITDMYLDDETGHINLARDPSGRLMFRQYLTQEGAAQFSLIDDRTHQVQHVQRDRLVSYPVWLTAEKDDSSKGVKKGDYIDYEGRKITDDQIYDPLKGRVPVIEKDGTARVELRSFDYFRGEAKRYNEWFEKKHKRKPNYYEKMYPEEAFARASLETEEAQARGGARYSLSYGAHAHHLAERLSKLREAMNFYNNLEKSLPEEERQKLVREFYERIGDSAIIPRAKGLPTDILKREIEQTEHYLQYAQTTMPGSENRALDLAESKRHLVAPIKRLERTGVRLYAEAGVHALRRTEDPNAPIVVAIEHIFPEQFGGHPEELKWIIRKSRERMVDLLTKPYVEYGESGEPIFWDKSKYTSEKGEMREHLQQNPYYMGVSPEEAKKLAEKHLKATIDTGHINMWRKYWQPDQKKTPEENDRIFKDWVVKAIETLAKDGMIGNVHLADNYGYHDDHLAPGQGNSPVREIMNVIRKYGYDKAITVEPGADAATDQSDFHGLMKTWRFFGSPVYGMGGSRAMQHWQDIQGAYFGQGRPPSYIFGAYAPSNEWSLWSQVPFE
jgi:RNA binding exosome subunit